jgi:uncharacterized RDD family membrane protein YckC
LFPTWKQEVNRRVADHLSHKTPSPIEANTLTENRRVLASRAAQAAARVAARYAQAPSYSEMLADEARAAVRAAEVASEAAQKAHEAAQSFLAGLEAATSVESEWELQPRQERARKRQSAAKPAEQNAHELHLFEASPLFAAAEAQEQHVPMAKPEEIRGTAEGADAGAFESGAMDWPGLNSRIVMAPDGELSLSEPIFANLIEFPRELVATRRVRPRRVEGPLAETDGEPQLSIFEVDPEAISTQPMATETNQQVAPVWMRPEWPAIELERRPREEFHESQASHMALQPAPLSRRLMAIAVDGALIVGVFLAIAMEIVTHVHALPGMRAMEVIAALAVLALGAGYLTLFFGLLKTTPGLWYAGIGLTTLEGAPPDRTQRYRRLMALPLSVLPLGLGLAWALFDDAHLTWHDRLSGTYLIRL